MGCIPEANSEYVARMEDVLDQYEQPDDPKRPLICYDEGLKLLIEETRQGISGKPGQREHYDYETKRKGVCNLNMASEPLIGKHYVRITERHTSQDFARCMKWLVDEFHPEAEVIRVVLDNLGPHQPAALYETFPPEEARCIVKQLEFHCTPKHASWLNMAEIELSVYSRSLKKHIPIEVMLAKEVQALTDERNTNHIKVDG